MRLFAPAALILTLALAACAGQPQIVNPSKTPEQSRADYDDCQGRVAVAIALAPKSEDIESTRMKAMDDCMKNKGYEVKESKWW